MKNSVNNYFTTSSSKKKKKIAYSILQVRPNLKLKIPVPPKEFQSYRPFTWQDVSHKAANMYGGKV